MTNNTTPVAELFEKVEDYSKKTIELLSLKAITQSADVISSLATQLAIAMVVVMFILTVNIGIALWIGELLGKTFQGFFVIAGFYIFMGILLRVFGHLWIKAPVSNSIINQMLKRKPE